MKFWQETAANFPEGKSVLLKPNLLSPHPPEDAVTTHPQLVLLLSLELGKYNNRVFIADSPAGTHNKNIPRLWRITGMQQAAAQAGAVLIDINRRGLVERKGLTRNFFFTDVLNEVDYVVNLPKLKTHGLTLLTGAVKNVFGLIPGIQKGEFHLRFPKPDDFSDNMVEIFAAVQPDFTVMDGISILEGNGPSSGGSVRHTGFLFAGEDAVAVDSVAAHSLGMDPMAVRTTQTAWRQEIGEARLSHIELSGDMLTPVSIDLPSAHAFSKLPDFIHRLLKKFIWVRPRANADKCTRCGMCIKNCPVEAMTPDADGVPIIDYSTCINCFCCAEVCPDDAIFQETSRLVRRLS